MNPLLHELKRKNPDLKVAEILGILHILLNSEKLTNNDLVRYTGLPKQTLKDFKSSVALYLQKTGNADEILLTVDGTKAINDLNPTPYKWSIVRYQNPEIEKKLEEVRKKYNLEPKREYDQFFATSQTSVAKAQILIDKGLVEGKSIALIGDDDLISVTLPLLNNTYAKITVFDIDTQILSTIPTICNDLGIRNVQTKQYDVRNNINKEDLAQYDIVMTDPPYTKSGISLFLNRGIDLLKPHNDFSGNYIFLFYGNSFKSPEKTLKIQDIINRYNLLVEDKLDKFATYFGAESIGSSSSLYILKQTPFTRSTDLATTSGIYTYESDKDEKFPFVDHVVAKVWDVDAAVLTSKNKMHGLLADFCKAHKLNVVDTKVTQFKGLGFTFTFILSNSSLVAHTWPEFNALHIDLITCKPIYAKVSLGQSLSKIFNTHKYEVRIVE